MAAVRARRASQDTVDMSMLDKAKKTALSLSIIVLFALYALHQRARTPQVPPAVVAALATTRPTSAITRLSNPEPTTTPTVAPTATRPAATAARTLRSAALAPTAPTMPTAAPTAPAPATAVAGTVAGTAAPSSTSGTSSAYRDGTYTGDSADANWGQVQVQVVISNGKISNVQFLDYPHDRSRSREINAMADPVLIQEAISAQQTQVDVVSGATDTSEAFIESLGSALQQANA